MNANKGGETEPRHQGPTKKQKTPRAEDTDRSSKTSKISTEGAKRGIRSEKKKTEITNQPSASLVLKANNIQENTNAKT